VFLVEQASDGYNAGIYAVARDLAELPFQIGFPVLCASIEYFMIGFYKSPKRFFIHTFLLVLMGNLGNSFGTCLASIFPTAEMASAVVPMFTLPFFCVCGLYANTKRLDPYFLWLNRISFIRYAFVGLFINEFEALDTLCDVNDTSCSYKTGQDVLEFYGFDNTSWVECMWCMILYMMGLKIIAALSLWYQGYLRRGTVQFKHFDFSAAVTPAAGIPPSSECSPHEPV